MTLVSYLFLRPFKNSFTFVLLFTFSFSVTAQEALQWQNVSSDFGPLPASVQVFKTTNEVDGKPNIAYYVKAKLDDKNLDFSADTTYQRRLTPQQFYNKNNEPLVVVNTTFFSFATNQNLNAVVKEGKLVSYNVNTIKNRGKDTLTYTHVFGSAIGISKKRKADVAWLYTDSAVKKAYAMQVPMDAIKDSVQTYTFQEMVKLSTYLIVGNHGFETQEIKSLKKWKVQTAVGGGPVLVQNGKIQITNNEERKFGGKAINDKHPRTAMGYTADGYLIILAVEGRNKGVAEGASLTQLAQMLKDIGCVEALNLDGGGSSCLLVNGKETIAPSDKVQRPIPAIFLISKKG